MNSAFNRTKYIVRFEHLWQGEWNKDFLSNNGSGFTMYDAEDIVNDLKTRHNIRDAHYEEYNAIRIQLF